MKFFKTLTLTGIFTISGLVWINLIGIEADLPLVSCPDKKVCVNLTLNLPPLPPLPVPPICAQTILFPCNWDAQVFHAAKNGTCDEDYNCHCNYDGTGQGSGGNGGIGGIILPNCTAESSSVCHCFSADPLVAEKAAEFCDFDCRCDHGAQSGTCDYVNKKCICNYSRDWNEAVDCPEFTSVTPIAGPLDKYVRSFCDDVFPLLTYNAAYCDVMSAPAAV